MAVTLEELQIKFTAEMGNLNSELNGIKKAIGGIEKPTGKAQSALSKFAPIGKMIAGAAIGAKLIGIGKEALEMANDVVESESLFAVSFGDMADSVTEWSKDLSDSLGINEYEARKTAGVLNTMFKSMGLGKQEAVDMSQSMVELANDMASFYNLPVDEAFTKLRAGITGEAEPLKQLGILVDETTVKHYALKEGLIAQGEEMTAQQKVQARYIAIMAQTGDAHGDLARTMDSPSNQLRRLNTEFDMAKIALGQALQPALLAVLPVLTSLATGAGDVIKALSGISGGTNTVFDDITVTLDQARTEVSSAVDSTYRDTVDKLKTLKTDTDTALASYIEDEKKTKKLAIEISLDPPTTTGADRIQTALDTLKESIPTTLDTTPITATLDAIMSDGTITTAEGYDMTKKVNTWSKTTIKAITIDAENKKKAIDVLVKNGIVTKEVGFDMKSKVTEEAEAAIGAVEAVVSSVNAVISSNGTAVSVTNLDTALTNLKALFPSSIDTTPITAKLDAIVSDGVVTKDETYDMTNTLNTWSKKEIDGIEIDAENKKKAIDVLMKNGTVSKEVGFDMKAKVDAEATAAIGAVTATVSAINVELGSEETLTKVTFSPEQAGILTGLITDGITSSTLVADAAVDQVNATFENTGIIGIAVDTLYAGLNTKVAELNTELSQITGKWAEDGLTGVTQEDWDRVLEIRAERERLLSILSGGLTSGGKLSGALVDLTLNTESIKNYFKAYTEAFTAESNSAAQALEAQKIILQNAFGQPEFSKILEGLGLAGLTIEQAIESLNKQIESALAEGKSQAIMDAAARLFPSIAEAIERGDNGAIKENMKSVTEFVNSVAKDFDTLSPSAQEAVLGMVGAFDGLEGVNTAFDQMRFDLLMQTSNLEPLFGEFATRAIDRLRDGFFDGTIKLDDYQKIFGAMSSKQALQDLANDFREGGHKSIVDLIDGMITLLPEVEATTFKLGKDATDTLREALENGAITVENYKKIIGASESAEALAALAAQMYKDGNKSTADLIKGMLEKQFGVAEAARLLEEAAKLKDPGGSDGVGQNVGQGLANGMFSKIGAVRQAAKDLANAAIVKMQNTTEEESPSKVTTKIGEYFGEGFINGIYSQTSAVAQTAGGLANTAIGAMNGSAVAPTLGLESQNNSMVRQVVQGVLEGMHINLYIDQTQLGKATLDATRHLEAAYGFRG